MRFDSGLMGLLEVLVVLAIVLFASRQLLLWYWKVNRLLALQERQVALLVEVRDALIRATSASPKPLGETTPETLTPAGSGPATPVAGAAPPRVSVAPHGRE